MKSIYSILRTGKAAPGLLMILMLFTSGLSAQQHPAWVGKVGARLFPRKAKVCTPGNYGAARDGSSLATKAIQQAIDDCARKGGGTVVFEPGIYLTGSIFLKTGVHLQIDKGVELRGSEHIEDYPEIDTRIAGIEMKWPAALINVLDCKNSAVTGDGVVNARGKVFWDMYWSLRKSYEAKGLRWVVDYDAKRPRTVLISGAADVTLRGLNLQQAGFWTVQVLYSDHVTVDKLLIQNNIGGHGPSTDGVDIDSSSWVLVENCDIDCNDDNFCLKSGRDSDGLRVNRPTEYVVIRNCVARKGGGLLTLGSETSGSIRHVLATDLRGSGTKNALNIKSAITRGGIVEDIYFENIVMDSVGTFLQINMNWNPSYSYSKLPEGYPESTLPPHWKKLLSRVEPAGRGIPVFRDVHLSNIRIKDAKVAINASGMRQSRLENFSMTNAVIAASEAGAISHASGWKFDKVRIVVVDGRRLTVTDSSSMDIAELR